MLRVLPLFLVLLALPTQALAQTHEPSSAPVMPVTPFLPPGEPSTPSAPPSAAVTLPAVQESTPLPPRSPGLAFALALGATAASYGIAAATRTAFVGDVGPIKPDTFVLAGILVAPSLGHFYAGAWGRGLAMSGVRLASGVGALAFFLQGKEELGALSGLIYAGATLFDIIDAPLAVKRRNKKALSLSPAPLPNATGVSPGLVLSGAF